MEEAERLGKPGARVLYKHCPWLDDFADEMALAFALADVGMGKFDAEQEARKKADADKSAAPVPGAA